MRRGSRLARVPAPAAVPAGAVARVTASARWLALAVLLAPAAASYAAAAPGACRGTLYLTLDTGTMAAAEPIARTLRRHEVKATFFLANEKTFRGDHALDAAWGDYWRARVAEGHAFGSHTWAHAYFRGDQPDGRTLYVHLDGRRERLDADGVCREVGRVDERFAELTGRRLDPLWRAPGGRTTPRVLEWTQSCGWRHVRWAPAGFLGDELPSDTHPNDALVKRALEGLRDGDVMMMHLGIRSRADPFAPMLEPLIAGLKQRGFCFATLPR